MNINLYMPLLLILFVVAFSTLIYLYQKIKKMEKKINEFSEEKKVVEIKKVQNNSIEIDGMNSKRIDDLNKLKMLKNYTF